MNNDNRPSVSFGVSALQGALKAACVRKAVKRNGGVTWQQRGGAACRLHGDTQVVVDGELVALQHVRPGEAVRLHDGGAAVAHGFAQRPARVDGPVEAHGREERAEEPPACRRGNAWPGGAPSCRPAA